MSETRMLDYSVARPTVAQIKASGAHGVMRYLTRSTGAKRLTATEATALRRAGLIVGVVFEDDAKRAAQGAAAGRADALLAASQAKTIGVPTSCPIFFAVDFDTTEAAVKAYFQGIAAAKIAHPVGVYGSFTVVEGVMTDGLARYTWQTAAWSQDAQHRPRVSVRAHLYQRVTPSHPVPGTDENVLLKSLPLWGVTMPVPKPAVKPAPVKKAPAPAPKPVAKTPAKPAPKPATKPDPRPSSRARARAILLHRLHCLHLLRLRRKR